MGFGERYRVGVSRRKSFVCVCVGLQRLFLLNFESEARTQNHCSRKKELKKQKNPKPLSPAEPPFWPRPGLPSNAHCSGGHCLSSLGCSGGVFRQHYRDLNNYQCFLGVPYYQYSGPQNLILIIKAPTLGSVGSSV